MRLPALAVRDARFALAAATGLLLGAAAGPPAAASEAAAPLLSSSLTLPAHLSVVEVDNSHADSWLEVDRTGNLQTGAGDAGSDHEH